MKSAIRALAVVVALILSGCEKEKTGYWEELEPLAQAYLDAPDADEATDALRNELKWMRGVEDSTEIREEGKIWAEGLLYTRMWILSQHLDRSEFLVWDQKLAALTGANPKYKRDDFLQFVLSNDRSLFERWGIDFDVVTPATEPEPNLPNKSRIPMPGSASCSPRELPGLRRLQAASASL